MLLRHSQNSYQLWLLWLLATILITINQLAVAAEKVGTISFARGTAAAHSENEQPRLLGKEAEIYIGDNIQTSERSFVIIQFTDGTKITVRPNSSFSVDQFSTSQEKASLTLHQGGVRASSGALANSSPNNLQIVTPHTTIKAQQAEFSVRVCEGDVCQQEEDSLKGGKTTHTAQVVARIVEIKNNVTALNQTDLSQETRLLHIGAPVYESDTLVSELDGYAVLVFRDHGRITIDSNTTFKISDYKFDNPENSNNAAYDLVTGAMRVLTGTIGKENKEAFKVNTPVATIGIRGTGFDLIERGKGLFSKVWKGKIFQKNNAGIFDLAEPNASHIDNKDSKPKSILELPNGTNSFKGPRPDQITIEDEPELFKAVQIKRTEKGTFVDVHSGHVQVRDKNGKFVDLGAGESSYTNTEGDTVRTEIAPKFMQLDPYPLPSGEFNENIAEVTTFSLLNDNMTLSANGDILQCECK